MRNRRMVMTALMVISIGWWLGATVAQSAVASPSDERGTVIQSKTQGSKGVMAAGMTAMMAPGDPVSISASLAKASDRLKKMRAGVIKNNPGNRQAGTSSIVRWVNPSGTCEGTPCYTTIQAAIAASATGDQIWVEPGTYVETGQFVIDKNLAILGWGAGQTIIKKAENTGDPGSGDARGWFLVKPGDSLELGSVTLDGAGRDIAIGVLSQGDYLWVHDSEIKNIGWQAGGPPSYYGRGVCVYGGGGNMVTMTTFTNIGRIGVFTFGAGVLTNIVQCTYEGKGAGDWLDYGFEVGGGAELAAYWDTVGACRGVASVDGSPSAGLLGTTYFGTGTAMSAEWNVITNCTQAVAVGYDGSDATFAVVRNDNLAGNDQAISNSNPANIVLAPLDWFGSAAPGDVLAQVGSGVDYSPWLDSGEDTDPDTANPDTWGFTPDLSKLWVDDSSPNFWPGYGVIQEGIDDVSGSTVYVAPGTYQLLPDSAIRVNKAVALIGDTVNPANVVINAPPSGLWSGRASCFTIYHDSVTIKGFHIQDAVFYPPGAYNRQNMGIWVGHNGNQEYPGTLSHFTITHNEITNCGYGIMLARTHDALVQYNKVWGSPTCSNTFGGKGIVVYGDNLGLAHNIQVLDNEIFSCGLMGIELNGNALGIPVANVATTVSRNKIYNNGGPWDATGSAFDAGRGISSGGYQTGVTVTDNEIYGHVTGTGARFNEKSSMAVRAILDSAWVIKNNSIHDNFRAVYLRGTGVNAKHVVENNTIFSNALGIDVERGDAGHAFNNSLYSNDLMTWVGDGISPLNVRNTDVAASIFNASGNWLGGNAPATVATTVSAKVDYTPWLDVGTDTGDPGFQGDFHALWADDDSPQTGTVNRVQEAVNMVMGSTIYLAPGTYAGQIVMTGFTILNLIGAGIGSTIIQPPPTPMTHYFTTSANNYAILSAENSDAVNISNLTVDGLGLGNINSRFIGIGYHNAGGTIDNCAIKDIRDTPISGGQHGIGVYAYVDALPDRTLNVTGCWVHGFQKGGITLNGTGLTAHATGCKIDGYGPASFIAMNGIQIGFGAAGTIASNQVSGCSYTGAQNASSAGLLLYSSTGPVTSSGNTIAECQIGINYLYVGGTILGNTVNATPAGTGLTNYWSIVADPGSGNTRQPEPQPFDDQVIALSSKGGSKSVPASIALITTLVVRNVVDGGGGGTGIEADAYGTEIMSLTASENTATNCEVGLVLYRDPTATLSATISDNVLAGNLYGLYNWISQVNATGNTFTNATNAVDGQAGNFYDANCWSDYNGFPPYHVGGAGNNVDNHPKPECGVACYCPKQGDINDDGVIDVFDVVGVIDIAFLHEPSPQDARCPSQRADADNNGLVDVFDVIYMIGTAFQHGPVPVDPCGP